MDDCSLAYDLTTEGYSDWWFPALGLIVTVGCAIIYVAFATVLRPLVPTSARKAMGGAVVLSPLWSIAMLILTYHDYQNLEAEYQRGAYQEVSGRIENFADSGPRLQPGTEKFTVAGMPFSYSQYTVSPGFRKTRASGGPLRDGLWVLIRYVGNAIVRLEICSHDG
jgi:hypothetical protein